MIWFTNFVISSWRSLLNSSLSGFKPYERDSLLLVAMMAAIGTSQPSLPSSATKSPCMGSGHWRKVGELSKSQD
jgi:hypothetical protein